MIRSCLLKIAIVTIAITFCKKSYYKEWILYSFVRYIVITSVWWIASCESFEVAKSLPILSSGLLLSEDISFICLICFFAAVYCVIFSYLQMPIYYAWPIMLFLSEGIWRWWGRRARWWWRGRWWGWQLIPSSSLSCLGCLNLAVASVRRAYRYGRSWF